MMLKYECEDPEDEWHDHGACVTQQLIVAAYYSQAMSLADKINILSDLYSSLVYWNHVVSESFLDTELGDKFEGMGNEAKAHRDFLHNLMFRDMGELFAEQNEKARNECSVHGTNWAQSCLRCKHAQQWLKAMGSDGNDSQCSDQSTKREDISSQES